MDNGQAESAPEAGGLTDLASFLDTPEEESNEETQSETVDESTAESDTDEPANDEQDDESEGDEPEEDEPAPVDKITVKVKADDGTEETLELTADEVASGYMRQAAFTKKTQALAARESEAVEFLKNKHDEVRNHYVNQAEAARAAVVQLAGLRNESEMAELASTDPAAWVAEVQRQKQIGGYLQGLDKQLAGERQRAEQETQQRQQQLLAQQYEKSWQDLASEKIDKSALAKIYGDVTKHYGYSDKELSSVYDSRLVKMMRDATAYQQLKAAKPHVTKKVQDAPRLPNRQAQPAQTRKDKELSARFQGGRAKLNDLAALLNS